MRHYVGYDRFEGAKPHRALQTLYAPLRLYLNFFLPDLKLLSKQRVDGKVRKTYDTAKTPYQRVLDSGILDAECRADLDATYRSLNPAVLKRQIEALQDTLWLHATVRFSPEAT